MQKLALPLALVLTASSGCVAVTYQRAGDQIRPRAGQTLFFGRVRFVHDGREFFPWAASLNPSGVTTNTERHLWLLRLGRRATSAELHPDGDGSLAIWLASGDYALLGSTQLLIEGAAPYEVVALFRVPAGAVAAYAGELTMSTESHEGARVARRARRRLRDCAATGHRPRDARAAARDAARGSHPFAMVHGRGSARFQRLQTRHSRQAAPG